MKNIKQYIMLAATLLFASCSQDEELNVPTVCPQEGDLVEITVGAPQGQNSRVSYEDGSTTPFAWESGDKIIAVGFGEDDSYIGQKVFTMKGDLPTDKKTATFEGELTSGATKYKLYYKAAKLTISEIEGSKGTPVIDYSAQTEDVANPTAHMKNYYLLGTEAISEADLLDGSKAKTLNLQNSLFRLDVQAMPELGVLQSIKLTTNNSATKAPSLSLAISNATASFVAYMLFDPEIMKQDANEEFVVTFTGSTKSFVHSKTATKAAFDKPGYRYKLKVDNNTKWIPLITTTSAGTITPEMINEAVGSTKKLAIVGPINGKDIKAIREAAGCTYEGGTIDGSATVTDLDLSGASIVASGDVYYNNGKENTIKADNQIGKYMFSGSKLSSITLPNTINTIEFGAFQGCNFLKTVIFETGGTENLTIGENVFYGSGITAVDIPKRTTVINTWAFQNCYSLETVTFETGGNEDLTIGSYAFMASIITAIDLPKRTKLICYAAFLDCNKLTSITLNTPYSEAVASNISFSSFGNAASCTLNLDNSWSGKFTGNKLLEATWGTINIDGTPVTAP